MSAPLTFDQLYKRDGRAGRDADGDGKLNERGNQKDGIGAAITGALAQVEQKINDTYRSFRGIGLRPCQVPHQNQADIRRGLHRYGRASGQEKMVARLPDGRVFVQPGEQYQVILSPEMRRKMQTEGTRAYHNHPYSSNFGDMVQPPSAPDFGTALLWPQANHTVYDNHSGSVYRWGRGEKYDEWANALPKPEQAPHLIQHYLQLGFRHRLETIVDELGGEREHIPEAARRASVFAHGQNLALHERGITRYRYRFSRQNQKQLALHADEITAGREDIYETLGAIDTALKELNANRKAKKPVAKRDGRAGRDADGDGKLNERGNQTSSQSRGLIERQPNGTIRVGETQVGLNRTRWSQTAPPIAASAAVAATATAIAAALSRSKNPTARAAGIAARVTAGVAGTAAVTLGGMSAANSVVYEQRMRAHRDRWGIPHPPLRDRMRQAWNEYRVDTRGDAANYDRPLEHGWKPAEEVGLPLYDDMRRFKRGTESAFPEGTRFETQIRRGNTYQDSGKYNGLRQWTTIPAGMVHSRFEADGMSGDIQRTFYREPEGALVAYHDGFVIEGRQGSGIARRVLKAQFDEYQKLGVKKVQVHANIDVGGYAWARFGFVPREQDWDRMRKSFKARVNATGDFAPGKRRAAEALKDLTPAHKRAFNQVLRDKNPKAIWKISDAKIGDRSIGKEMLIDSNWHGTIELDDTEAMNRFKHYVGK